MVGRKGSPGDTEGFQLFGWCNVRQTFLAKWRYSPQTSCMVYAMQGKTHPQTSRLSGSVPVPETFGDMLGLTKGPCWAKKIIPLFVGSLKNPTGGQRWSRILSERICIWKSSPQPPPVSPPQTKRWPFSVDADSVCFRGQQKLQQEQQPPGWYASEYRNSPWKSLKYTTNV